MSNWKNQRDLIKNESAKTRKMHALPPKTLIALGPGLIGMLKGSDES